MPGSSAQGANQPGRDPGAWRHSDGAEQQHRQSRGLISSSRVAVAEWLPNALQRALRPLQRIPGDVGRAGKFHWKDMLQHQRPPLPVVLIEIVGCAWLFYNNLQDERALWSFV